MFRKIGDFRAINSTFFGPLKAVKYVDLEQNELQIYGLLNGQVCIDFKYRDTDKYTRQFTKEKDFCFKSHNVFSCDWTNDLNSLQAFIEIVDEHHSLGRAVRFS